MDRDNWHRPSGVLIWYLSCLSWFPCSWISAADTLLDRDDENLEVRTKAEVDVILFDGDEDVPPTARRLGQSSDEPLAGMQTPTARCVRFKKDGGTACVRQGGRIYLTAGAIHTPALLMKSGIGPGGERIDNKEAGR